MKTCEKCGVEIPEDYKNLLCSKHYKEVENQAKGNSIPEILMGENYTENDEVEELDLVSRSHGRFKGNGLVMPESQRTIYEKIRDTFHQITQDHPQFPKFIFNPNVCDVGCGLGIGSNILSQGANFVWGIDKNPENISWAKQNFTRVKNEIYYSSQVTFDEVDIVSDPREFMRFDVVTAIEIIEHFKDPSVVIKFIKRVSKPNAIVYISTPNRRAWIGTERFNTPLNPHHVREFTAEEFVRFLEPHFSRVELLNKNLELVSEDTIETPLVARCYE